MKSEAMVSIIIPTYNNWPVVCQAVDCALGQTWPAVEVIVVDDGSVDGSSEQLAAAYGDRIILVRQENRGAGGARNTGIRHASGEYLQFLDADDLISADKIALQMRQLHQVARPAVSYCDYVCCDMENRPLATGRKRKRLVLDERSPFEDIMMQWETELSIPIHCFLFDAALFRGGEIAFDESLSANEDWDCWMNLFAQRPETVFVDKVLASYRMRSGSRASDRLSMRNSYLAAIDRQVVRNSTLPAVVAKLLQRKKQIKCFYRDTSPIMRALDRLHPLVKRLYVEKVPWRLQRLFD